MTDFTDYAAVLAERFASHQAREALKQVEIDRAMSDLERRNLEYLAALRGRLTDAT
jgi:hypothetical protein